MNQVILQVLAFHLQSPAHGVPKEQAKPGKKYTFQFMLQKRITLEVCPTTCSLLLF